MNDMRTVNLLFLGLGFFLAADVAAQTVTRSYSPLSATPSDGLTFHGRTVMVELYKQLDMEFDEPIPRPAPPSPRPAPPKPQPQPQPAPEPPQKKDDFFGDDDGFFDDDVGFDDVVEGFDDEYEATVEAWEKQYEETLKRWGLAKKEYEKKKDQYMEATYDLSAFESDGTFDASMLAAGDGNKVPTNPGDYYVIPYAFVQQIQDQANRGTCAAFAGVRAIETLVGQHSTQVDEDRIDLSEQQFFYLARVDCIEKPCAPQYGANGRLENDGSNYDLGFEMIKRVDHPDASLVSERDCPYRPTIKNNVTYSPVSDFCAMQSRDRYKVSRFNSKLPFDYLLSELRANRPIAASFRLPQSFRDSDGLVSLIDPNTRQGTGPHAGGHAMTLIGYVMLPEKFWPDEGKYCVITANSWGEGWGAGGYACMTEKWMRRFYKYATSLQGVRQLRF